MKGRGKDAVAPGPEEYIIIEGKGHKDLEEKVSAHGLGTTPRSELLLRANSQY